MADRSVNTNQVEHARKALDVGVNAQLVILPLSLMSRLLAPTERPVTPEAICQLCEGTSQTEKSYRESSKVTVLDSPGWRKTASKPLRFIGACFADAGGEVYSCGTSVPAFAPVFLSVKETVTTVSCSLRGERSGL